MPAHLAAYLVIAAAIAWSHPPGRLAWAALAAPAAVFFVSFASSAPVVAIGIGALVAALPAAVFTAVTLAMLVRGRAGDDAALTLLWLALFVALPATFAGAYLGGAGLFCF